jgi:hypothetical protein
MKFFTRELYERGQSTDDAILDEAEDEWEIANKLYEQHLNAIAAGLPTHIRAFNDLLLHDAVVQSIARQADRLVVIVRKDIPPRDLVILNYELDGEPVVEPFARNPRDWSGLTDFNFDEFDVIQEAGRTLYTQEIVCANGWLLRLRFWDVRFTLASPLYLAPQPGPALVAAPFFPQSG